MHMHIFACNMLVNTEHLPQKLHLLHSLFSYLKVCFEFNRFHRRYWRRAEISAEMWSKSAAAACWSEAVAINAHRSRKAMCGIWKSKIFGELFCKKKFEFLNFFRYRVARRVASRFTRDFILVFLKYATILYALHSLATIPLKVS